MALGKQVEESIDEAVLNLRNALAFAARHERPAVCHQLTKVVVELEHMKSWDEMLDKVDELVDKSSDD